MFHKGKPTANFPRYYDSHIQVTIPYYDSFHTEIINLIKAIAWEPVLWLDTGCGTGTLAQRAVAVFPNTKFLLGDPSPEMLDVAQTKLYSHMDRITILERSSTQEIAVPMEKHPDVITAVLCHHYLHEKERVQATEKCYRLLKKGGVYITFENITPFTSEGIAIGNANWKNFQINSGKAHGEAENHIQRFGVEYFPITIEEHLSLLHNTGFKAVEMLWYSYLQAGFYCIK